MFVAYHNYVRKYGLKPSSAVGSKVGKEYVVDISGDFYIEYHRKICLDDITPDIKDIILKKYRGAIRRILINSITLKMFDQEFTYTDLEYNIQPSKEGDDVLIYEEKNSGKLMVLKINIIDGSIVMSMYDWCGEKYDIRKYDMRIYMDDVCSHG